MKDMRGLFKTRRGYAPFSGCGCVFWNEDEIQRQILYYTTSFHQTPFGKGLLLSNLSIWGHGLGATICLVSALV